MLQMQATHSTIQLTQAVQRMLAGPILPSAQSDYLFLEAWERAPSDNAGAALRMVQIRRANPALAAEIRAEIKFGRPLTEAERAKLGS